MHGTRTRIAPAKVIFALACAGCATAPAWSPGPPPRIDLLFQWNRMSGGPAATPVLDVVAQADVDLDGRDDVWLEGVFGDKLYFRNLSQTTLYGLPLDSKVALTELVSPIGEVEWLARPKVLTETRDIGPAARSVVDASGEVYYVTDNCEVRRAFGSRSGMGSCQGVPRWLEIDATNLYVFTEPRDQMFADTTLWSVPKIGGTPPRQIANLGRLLWGVFATDRPLQDDRYFYVTRFGDVLRVPQQGGPGVQMASAPTGQGFHGPALVDSGGLLWETSGRIFALSRDGGFGLIGNAGTRPQGNGVDHDRVCDIAARGDNLVYARSTGHLGGGLVIARSRTKGSLRILSIGQTTPTRLRVDDGAIYFIDAGTPFSDRGGFLETVGCCSIWTVPLPY